MVAVAVVFWSRIWPFLLAAVVLAAVGGLAWWGWRTHRTLREQDRRWRAEDRVLTNNRSLADVDQLSGDDFEMLVAALFRRDGCGEVEKVGRSGDRGRDVTGRLPDGRAMVVQCKRYAPHRSVRDAEMRDLLGVRTHFGADLAVFVTNTRFTGPATATAVANGIVLIHRDHLAAWRGGAPFFSFLEVNGRGQGDRRHLRRWRRTYDPGRSKSRQRKRSQAT